MPTYKLTYQNSTTANPSQTSRNIGRFTIEKPNQSSANAYTSSKLVYAAEPKERAVAGTWRKDLPNRIPEIIDPTLVNANKAARDARHAFLDQLLQRIDPSAANAADTETSRADSSLNGSARTALSKVPLQVAEIFSREVRPATRDEALQQRDHDPFTFADKKLPKANEIFNDDFNAYKKEFVKSNLLILRDKAKHLPDDDLIKNALRNPSHISRRMIENLDVQYMFREEGGKPIGKPIGVFLKDMKDDDAQWALNFADGEITKVAQADGLPPNKLQAFGQTMALRGGPTHDAPIGKGATIRAGTLEALIAKHYGDAIETQRENYRGATSKELEKRPTDGAIAVGAAKGIGEYVPGIKTYQAYKKGVRTDIKKAAETDTKTTVKYLTGGVSGAVVGAAGGPLGAAVGFLGGVFAAAGASAAKDMMKKLTNKEG